MIRAFGILAVALAAAGCGSDGDAGGGVSPQQKRDLHALGLAYHSYHESNNKGPADAKAFRAFALKSGDQDARSALDGVDRGDYVVFYGVRLTGLTKGTGNTVLAYHKDAPSGGGAVLMADGTVRSMTASEFAASPKAGEFSK